MRLFELLTPVLQEIKVQPEMLLKTRHREHGTREYGTRGVPILAYALPGMLGRVKQGAHTPVTGYPGNILKTRVLQNPFDHHPPSFANSLSPDSRLLLLSNEGATGDVDENKGERPKSEVRSPKSKGLGGGGACSDSWLLTSDS